MSRSQTTETKAVKPTANKIQVEHEDIKVAAMAEDDRQAEAQPSAPNYEPHSPDAVMESVLNTMKQTLVAVQDASNSLRATEIPGNRECWKFLQRTIGVLSQETDRIRKATDDGE